MISSAAWALWSGSKDWTKIGEDGKDLSKTIALSPDSWLNQIIPYVTPIMLLFYI